MENFEVILKRELSLLEERLEQKLEQKLEEKLDEKLEEKLEEKLNQKLDEKLDQKLAPIKSDILGMQSDIKGMKIDMRKMQYDIQEMQKTVFLLENEQGRKIDAMYDFIMLEQEKREQQGEEVKKIEKRVDRTEVKIFDHDNRIIVLEKKIDSVI